MRVTGSSKQLALPEMVRSSKEAIKMLNKKTHHIHLCSLPFYKAAFIEFIVSNSLMLVQIHAVDEWFSLSPSQLQ